MSTTGKAEPNIFNDFGGFGAKPKKAKSAKRRRSGRKSNVLTGERADHATVFLAVVIKTGADEKTVIADAKKVCKAEAKKLAKSKPTLEKLGRLNFKGDLDQSAEQIPAKSSPKSKKKAGR